MQITQKISPCLWFDDQAEEAAKFYTSVFPNSKVVAVTHYGKAGHEIHGRAVGSVMTVVQPMFLAQLPDWVKRQRDPDVAAMASAWEEEHQQNLQQARAELEKYRAAADVFRRKGARRCRRATGRGNSGPDPRASDRSCRAGKSRQRLTDAVATRQHI